MQNTAMRAERISRRISVDFFFMRERRCGLTRQDCRSSFFCKGPWPAPFLHLRMPAPCSLFTDACSVFLCLRCQPAQPARPGRRGDRGGRRLSELHAVIRPTLAHNQLFASHFCKTRHTASSTVARASHLSRPFAKSSSYFVSRCRT